MEVLVCYREDIRRLQDQSFRKSGVATFRTLFSQSTTCRYTVRVDTLDSPCPVIIEDMSDSVWFLRISFLNRCTVRSICSLNYT